MQGGRFGKLNKRISFPETFDLGPYMSGGGEGSDVYKLYAVIVHLDMLNASFFGHYICFIIDTDYSCLIKFDTPISVAWTESIASVMASVLHDQARHA